VNCNILKNKGVDLGLDKSFGIFNDIVQYDIFGVDIMNWDSLQDMERLTRVC